MSIFGQLSLFGFAKLSHKTFRRQPQKSPKWDQKPQNNENGRSWKGFTVFRHHLDQGQTLISDPLTHTHPNVDYFTPLNTQKWGKIGHFPHNSMRKGGFGHVGIKCTYNLCCIWGKYHPPSMFVSEKMNWMPFWLFLEVLRPKKAQKYTFNFYLKITWCERFWVRKVSAKGDLSRERCAKGVRKVFLCER